MMRPIRYAWLFLGLAITTPAAAQDISWTQPYSGNIVYGPLSPDPGKLPNCPECQCDTCRPGGAKGFFRRLFGGTCEQFRETRRDCYFNEQLYHTKYTPPVLPPYCEVGYGYYQTSWRQPMACPDPIERPGVYPGGSDWNEPPVIPAPAPIPPGVEPKGTLEQESHAPPQEPAKNQVPGPAAGDEKPRYEEPMPKTGAMGWKQVTPLARQLYQGPVITPR